MQTANLRNYVHVWIYSIVGFACVVLGVKHLSQLANFDLGWAAILLFGLLVILVAMYSLIVHLEWNDESMVLVVGPYKRRVSLLALRLVGYRRSGRTVLYYLKDTSGAKLKLEASMFKRDDVWKKLILKAADRAGAEVDPRARESLTNTNGRGDGYIV